MFAYALPQSNTTGAAGHHGQIRRLLLPKIQPRPLLIEPDQIPLITDAVQARLHPRETIFAALYHVRETAEPIDVRVAGMRAAVVAIRALDREEQLRYGDMMFSFTPTEIMQRVLDELRESGEHEEPLLEEPVLYRDSYAYVKGEQDGREAGRAVHRDALRRLLIDILEIRGVPLASTTRARIEQCDDIEALTRWCANASVCTVSAEDLFGKPTLTLPDQG